MSILLIIFWFHALAAFICSLTNHPIWCGISIALAIMLALMAMAYEGRLINRIKALEEEVYNLKRRF